MSTEEVKEEVKEETVATEATEDKKELSAEEVLYAAPKEEQTETSEEKTEVSEDKVADTSEENKEEKVADSKEIDKDTDTKLELTENSFLDNSAVEDVKALAKENNLTTVQAQKLLSKQEEAVKNWIDTQLEEVEQQKTTWREQVESDKVLGGNNLEGTVKNARGVVDRFANDEVKTLLRDTGYGNHPAIVSFLSEIGKAMGDDSLVKANAKDAAPKSIEEVFYGSQK